MPKDLADMAAAFAAKCKAGTAQIHGSGYGGSGFKFDSVEDDVQKASRQVSTLQGLAHSSVRLEKHYLSNSCTLLGLAHKQSAACRHLFSCQLVGRTEQLRRRCCTSLLSCKEVQHCSVKLYACAQTQRTPLWCP